MMMLMVVKRNFGYGRKEENGHIGGLSWPRLIGLHKLSLVLANRSCDVFMVLMTRCIYIYICIYI